MCRLICILHGYVHLKARNVEIVTLQGQKRWSKTRFWSKIVKMSPFFRIFRYFAGPLRRVQSLKLQTLNFAPNGGFLPMLSAQHLTCTWFLTKNWSNWPNSAQKRPFLTIFRWFLPNFRKLILPPLNASLCMPVMVQYCSCSMQYAVYYAV